VDELTLLRDLVAVMPAEDTAARSDVWRRLQRRRTPPRVSRTGALSLGVAAVAVAGVLLAFGVRGVGVEPAKAACTLQTSPDQCARDMAAVLLAPARAAATSNRIAYSLFHGSSADIYTANPDGSDVSRLTHGPGRAAFPAWSPDGTRIAFDWTGRNVPNGIYVMNADGSHKRLVARGAWAVPQWSPDGSKIAFFRGTSIYVVERNGNRLDLVQARGWTPSWSPDGTTIAYTGLDASSNNIYVMKADGTGKRLLGAGSFPSWSPDGRTIAFHGTSNAVDHSNPIWTMQSDGSDRRPLNLRTWNDCPLAWTRDGRLAFTNPTGAFVARPGVSPVRRLSMGGDVCGLAWQPARR
jgi:Tol biopolymer transport system component